MDTGDREIILSPEEHKAYIEYQQIRSEYEGIERQ